ncbi:hypothetical protein F442_07480 [Phytophthora nicotianae P10297]|uniref:Uncharacterized protein n=1 Tax=Phytophthora nicotianae P10297 TaxID=1317064 RepID=W2ZH03_PHYNI|nr:hypothetical protein F442_07480 [Phytophthora nicotianae P10297]
MAVLVCYDCQVVKVCGDNGLVLVKHLKHYDPPAVDLVVDSTEAVAQFPGSASPTGSSQHSHYASATSMADSDTSEGIEQMQLGPSGAAMLLW